ncbi:carboxylesterase/lipase family protein [Actinomadura sp. BRA 177]|uniref:carboxylesterase/lipase family protein n=1 Tax=Actinomadura sp. BRA 177 TaxID=2745202 RepID=UPI001595C4CC|nr:carboxylesterase family protein [Actinomadura sp. BRA 177]NVI90249.1 carboxylesterase family protein [Actinomadura sp. BRA 177]
MDEVEAGTVSGAVRGVRKDGTAVFLGIPFARPPVGALRFAAPRPPEPWDGARPATAFGPPPPQSSALGQDVPETTGDDWLTCNVWTPDPGGAGLPVMVWIYGGAYLIGHSSDPAYDGTVLSHGGVVVVTFNYRVAMEGFGQIEGAPANRGLLDQVAALAWVQENIAAFGGDPDNVTVFGESAGAGSIAALLAMPGTGGLFHRAIVQSVPGTFFSRPLADDIGATIAAEAGVRPVREDLATVTPAQLTRAVDAVTATMRNHPQWGQVSRTPTPFSPVVDGEVLPQTPWAALKGGAARDIPLVVGHNRDEYRLFVALEGLLGRVTDEQASSALQAFAPDPASYRAAFPDASPETLYELVHSDWLFRMPTLHLAEAQAAAGGRVHLYELAWRGGPLGACHALDVPLVWGNLTGGMADPLISDQRQAAALSAKIRTAWTAFAETGTPGWPAFNTHQRLTHVLDTTPSTTQYQNETSRTLWSTHTFAPLPLVAPGPHHP